MCQALWLQPACLASHPPACSICRCGCVTMLKSPNKTTAVKQWEQRWIKNCLCGGPGGGVRTWAQCLQWTSEGTVRVGCGEEPAHPQALLLRPLLTWEALLCMAGLEMRAGLV